MKEPSDRAVKWAPYLRGGAASTADLLDLKRERGADLLLTGSRPSRLPRGSRRHPGYRPRQPSCKQHEVPKQALRQ